MAGTTVGGRSAAETNFQVYGKDFYSKIGTKGGKAPHKTPRGFAAMDKEKLRELGRRAGKISGYKWKPRAHCRRGHALDADNLVTYVNTQGYTIRRCRQCVRLNAKRYAKEQRRKAREYDKLTKPVY